MRIGGGATCSNAEIPADPGPVILERGADARIRERCFRADKTPNRAVEALVEVVAARQRHPLLDPVGRNVVRIYRATHRLAGTEDLGEAEAEIGPSEERIPRPIEHSARRAGAIVGDHHFRSVRLISDDIPIGLLNAQTGCADIHDRDDLEWVDRRPGSRDRGLTDRREHCVRSEVACCCYSVIGKIGRVQRPTHGDERAAVPWNCVRRIELVGRSIGDVLDLAA